MAGFSTLCNLLFHNVRTTKHLWCDGPKGRGGRSDRLTYEDGYRDAPYFKKKKKTGLP